MEKGIVQIGIGGWEHEVFDRCLYGRQDATPGEKLAHYAEFFDAAEVRPTFWDDSLTAADALAWIEAVKENRKFLFSVKLHASFTHRREIRTQLTQRTRGILQELFRAGRLGALLMQFPYAFTNTSGNRYHLEKLAEVYRGFPLFVELRHESWNVPGLLPFLSEASLCPVSLDLPRVRQYMPHTTFVIGDTAYLRLHGRNEKGWLLNAYDARYDYLYNSREIRELNRRLTTLSQRCNRVIVICNNTTSGKAVATAFQLQAALSGAMVRIPAPTLQAFPHLESIAEPAPQEGFLFASGAYRRAM